MSESWMHKRVLVVGLARSGLAAAELLSALGAHVVLSDAKGDISGLDRLLALGCEARVGVPSETLVAGCDAVIISPAVPKGAPVVIEAQKLSVPLYSELEFAAGLLQGTQIGITGTNGKTTTCALTGEILKKAGKSTRTAGNIGLALSAVVRETTPESYTVIEVSSFQLEQMQSFHPHGAAILNLTPDHLNRHGTMEAYGALKESMLQNQNETDFFVYNVDDPFCVSVAKRAKARIVPFSVTKVLKEGAWVQDGQIMVAGRALCSVEELSLPGAHNLQNALAASAIASELMVPAPVIRHTLRTFQGVEHRMEMVGTIHGVSYINDSKGTNPESSVHAVRSMSAPTALIAGGDDKGMDFSVFAQEILKNQNIIHVVLIGKSSQKLQKLLDEMGYTAYTVAGFDFEKAIDMARRQVMGGGTVLLSPACASFDMFKDFEERGTQFKEYVQMLR